MKHAYLEIIDLAFSAYDEERIRKYIADVKENGVTEHGFPRLAANLAILIVHGRKESYLPLLVEMLDLCFCEKPNPTAGNDFSVRELCFALEALEKGKILSSQRLQTWKRRFSTWDPWKTYKVIAPTPNTPVGNWAAFAAISEFVRGKYCGIDSSAFVDWQISSQLLSFDENGMYRDPNEPMVYDMMTRILLSMLLSLGYRGKFYSAISEQLDRSADITLKMQSVTGEIPFGGRSNQFYHNEAMLSAYCEIEAGRWADKGDLTRAEAFRGAAKKAALYTLSQLRRPDLRHVKNRYGIDSLIGCEGYGYFDKYMITTASNIYLALKFSRDDITPGVAPADQGAYFVRTGEAFHKAFLNSSSYFVEWDINADFHYDANGIGRIHKRNAPSTACLSVPFPPAPKYRLEREIQPGAMSLCSYWEGICGAEKKYSFVSQKAEGKNFEAVFSWEPVSGVSVKEICRVDDECVTLSVEGSGNVGWMLPIFFFDGEKNTKIRIKPGEICVKHQNFRCVYRFDGTLSQNFTEYCNRNGRYRVYRMAGKEVKILIEEEENEV